MKVGYVLKKFPRLSETFILNEVLELQRQGVEVTIFSLHRPDDGLFHARLAELRTPVVYLPVRNSQATFAHLRRSLPFLRQSHAALWSQFERLLSEAREDWQSILGFGLEVALLARERGITHLHAHFATVAACVARAASALGGVPFSFTCHAKDIYREGVAPERFTALCDPARFVVTVCDANRQFILERLATGSRTPVRTLYNGVDLEQFHPRRRQPDAVPLLLGIGRLVAKKGFDLLIRAAAGLRAQGLDLRCAIVGDGEERPRLAALIQELGQDGIELLGARSQDEVRELMGRAAVFALPCVIGEDGNRDALPTVLLEALAAGTPAVSMPVGGVAEILAEGRCGGLVPVGDTAALQAAIGELLRHPARGAQLARLGREHAEARFDLRRNVATLRGWFAAGATVGAGAQPVTVA